MHLLDLAESENSRVYRLEYMDNSDPIQLDEGEAATVKVDELVMHIKRDSKANSTHVLAKETGVQLVGDGTIHIVSKTSLQKDGTLERKGGGNSDQVTLVETTAKTKQASLTQKRIAELTGTHEKTIGKLKMARDEQNCERQMDENNVLRTTELPAAGKQGGFRWCRLNEEQKSLCTRIAIENPQLSVGQIRNRLLEACPDLKVSESTIWRSLNASNLQMLRAKMRDPRSEGTPAHAAEKEAFLREQKKGADGMLGGHNLFFMDETNVSLNLTAKRAWGTSKTPAEVKHAKGKTMTIGVYAGIGLVSGTNSSSSAPPSSSRAEGGLIEAAYRGDIKLEPTDPRGNHLAKDGDGRWRVADPPKFMLFWWLRPPRRESNVDRFQTKTTSAIPHSRGEWTTYP